MAPVDQNPIYERLLQSYCKDKGQRVLIQLSPFIRSRRAATGFIESIFVMNDLETSLPVTFVGIESISRDTEGQSSWLIPLKVEYIISADFDVFLQACFYTLSISTYSPGESGGGKDSIPRNVLFRGIPIEDSLDGTPLSAPTSIGNIGIPVFM